MKIAIEPSILKDESLSSWLIRTSIANGSDPSGWVYGIWGDYRVWTRDIDRYFPRDKLERLSNISSKSIKQIEHLTMLPYIEKILSETKPNPLKSWYFVVSTGSRGGYKINGTHFCPRCLQEDTVYGNLKYRFGWNIYCEKHNVRLIGSCQKCGSSYMPHLVTYLKTDLRICHSCSCNLSDSETIQSNAEVLGLQKRLNRVLFDNQINHHFPVVDNNVSELFLSCRALLSITRVICKVNRQSKFSEKLNFYMDDILMEKAKGVSFENMDILSREHLLIILARLLSLSLDEIIELLLDLNISQNIIQDNISIKTNTIKKILDSLPLNSRMYQRKAYFVPKKIIPKSAEYVAQEMKKLEKFL